MNWLRNFPYVSIRPKGRDIFEYCIFYYWFKHNKSTLDTELKNTKTTKNTTTEIDKVEETYKGFDDLDYDIQDVIDVSSSQNKGVIGIN